MAQSVNVTPGYIVVMFNAEVTKEEAVELIERLETELITWFPHFKSAVVKVPESQERSYIKKFCAHAIVDRAMLNSAM